MMRALIACGLSLGLIVGCAPPTEPDASASASPPVAASSPSGTGTPCTATIPARGVGTATLTELPHTIGPTVVFGLDGSFVASAYGYPLGAQWRWFELDGDGALIQRFEWRWQGGLIQSPDGSKVVYNLPTDNTSGRMALFVREMSGPERLLSSIHATPLRWLDADRILVDSRDHEGVIHSVDTRTGVDQVAFSPPPPPSLKADGDNDFFSLSGDLRWAVFTRSNAAGTVLRQDLFDVARQSYVPGARLPMTYISLAPVGDDALWLERGEVRAMHLCDRRVVTIGSIANTSQVVRFRWSPDGRYVSFAFGPTTVDIGPESIVFVDLQQGAIAEIQDPWGYVSQWSPDARYVVINRAGFHGPTSKLARFEFK